jgi:hypothetical protein
VTKGRLGGIHTAHQCYVLLNVPFACFAARLSESRRSIHVKERLKLLTSLDADHAMFENLDFDAKFIQIK